MSLLISEKYEKLIRVRKEKFDLIKNNEEELNQIFIESYGMENDLTSSVKDELISLKTFSLKSEVQSLISYIVGCMFGRYSLDYDGIAFAGDKWDGNKYKTFIPDTDNCIPITAEEYFVNDILDLFLKFIKIVYGEETLEENIDFIAKALGNRGNSSQEVIRNYFISEFFVNHIKLYQKRPIYWLFDSGKENAFKALIYMHRYDKDTVGRVRSDYLHKTQNAIEGALKNAEYIITSSSNAIDKAKATKDRDKYIKQSNEIRIYDQALAHIALQRIEIDLDDGVKHNYELFQGVEISNEGSKKQTIDLLAKI